MQKIYIIVILITLCSLELFSQNLNPMEEKESIKKVLNDAERAYWDKDSTLYASCYSSQETVYNLGYGIEVGPINRIGYSPIGNARIPVTSETRTHTFENKDYVIFVDGNLAWATFMQVLKHSTEQGEKISVLRHNKTLIKENGKWKIINNTRIEVNRKPKEIKYFGSLEQVCSFMLDEEDYEKALEVAKFRHQWYPGSAHSLFLIGYCYEKLGKNKKARKYYQNAITAFEFDQPLTQEEEESIKWFIERGLNRETDDKEYMEKLFRVTYPTLFYLDAISINIHHHKFNFLPTASLHINNFTFSLSHMYSIVQENLAGDPLNNPNTLMEITGSYNFPIDIRHKMIHFSHSRAEWTWGFRLGYMETYFGDNYNYSIQNNYDYISNYSTNSIIAGLKFDQIDIYYNTENGNLGKKIGQIVNPHKKTGLYIDLLYCPESKENFSNAGWRCGIYGQTSFTKNLKYNIYGKAFFEIGERPSLKPPKHYYFLGVTLGFCLGDALGSSLRSKMP